MIPVALIVLAATIVLALAAIGLFLSAGGQGSADLFRAGQGPSLPPSPSPQTRGGLSRAVRQHLDDRWRGVQEHFVDDPRSGILAADRLVESVIRLRGFKVPHLGAHLGAARSETSRSEMPGVDRYRAAHLVALRRLDPNVRTETLWRAMIDYQAVLDALLDPDLSPSRAGGGAGKRERGGGSWSRRTS